MTGQCAISGVRCGRRKAVKDLAADAACRRQLTLEVGDDACDPKQAVAVASQMVKGRGGGGRAFLLGLNPSVRSLQ
jgi:branched-chain amino acid transport system substrate-binding protein